MKLLWLAPTLRVKLDRHEGEAKPGERLPPALVELARRHGYRCEELIEIIETIS